MLSRLFQHGAEPEIPEDFFVSQIVEVGFNVGPTLSLEWRGDEFVIPDECEGRLATGVLRDDQWPRKGCNLKLDAGCVFHAMADTIPC